MGCVKTRTNLSALLIHNLIKNNIRIFKEPFSVMQRKSETKICSKNRTDFNFRCWPAAKTCNLTSFATDNAKRVRRLGNHFCSWWIIIGMTVKSLDIFLNIHTVFLPNGKQIITVPAITTECFSSLFFGRK